MNQNQTKNSNAEINTKIQEAVKPWNLNSSDSFQVLFPFQNNLEKRINFLDVNILNTHNAMIKQHLGIFPETTNAYWQIYRRNICHSRVQIPKDINLSMEDLDIKTAKQFIELRELIGKSDKIRIATSSLTKTQEIKYISIKTKPKYKLIDQRNHEGILLYVFENLNNNGAEEIEHSFFDLNSSIVPFLKKYK